MNLFAKETSGQKFWKWFIKSESKIYSSDNNAPILNELSKKLSEYKDGITYELTVEDNGKKQFIISADGIKENFQDVISLYKKAPQLKRWEIIAFRPRMKDFSQITLNYGSKEFDPKNIWIHPIIEGENFDMIIYHPEFTEGDKNIIISGIYILLDTALGEYDVATGIRYLDFQKLPENPIKEGLIPFIELRETFDKFKPKKG